MSAIVLLLPPIALGAAVYAMLPAREQATAPPVGRTVADIQATAQQPATETWPPAEAQPPAPEQPAAVASQPRTAAPKPTASSPSFALASARQESTGRAPAKDNGTKDAAAKDPGTKDAVSTTGKDTARVLGAVPVRVTVVVPPSAAASPPATEADSAPTGSISAPARVAAAEMPEPAPPLVQVPAVQEPATQSPTAEVPPASAGATRRHGRFSYLRHLARRNNLHAEARSEARTARWNTRSDQAFSLRNWLSNVGTTSRQRNGRS